MKVQKFPINKENTLPQAHFNIKAIYVMCSSYLRSMSIWSVFGALCVLSGMFPQQKLVCSVCSELWFVLCAVYSFYYPVWSVVKCSVQCAVWHRPMTSFWVGDDLQNEPGYENILNILNYFRKTNLVRTNTLMPSCLATSYWQDNS